MKNIKKRMFFVLALFLMVFMVGGVSSDTKIPFNVENIELYMQGVTINSSERDGGNSIDFEIEIELCDPFELYMDFDDEYFFPMGIYECYPSSNKSGGESGILYLNINKDFNFYRGDNSFSNWIIFIDKNGEHYMGLDMVGSYRDTSYNPIINYTTIYLSFIGFSVGESGNRVLTTLYVGLESQDNETVEDIGSIDIMLFKSKEYEQKILDLENNQSSQETKISELETWKQTIDTWKTSVTETLTTIQTSLTLLQDCCGGVLTGAGTWDNFKNYISSSTRKKMVCDYAKENRLENINELGYDCDLEYRTYSSGRERVYCRCDRV